MTTKQRNNETSKQASETLPHARNCNAKSQCPSFWAHSHKKRMTRRDETQPTHHPARVASHVQIGPLLIHSFTVVDSHDGGAKRMTDGRTIEGMTCFARKKARLEQSQNRAKTRQKQGQTQLDNCVSPFSHCLHGRP